jgi:V-type H+-transporting ATPase subunit C
LSRKSILTIFKYFRGNLFVRDLVDVLKEPIVKPKDFVYSEYLTTVIAIVPK